MPVLFPWRRWISAARIRTGPATGQQSAHVTVQDFDDNPIGEQDLAADRWFVARETARRSLWLGRNSAPFFKIDELAWDDDVTGLGVGVRQRLGPDAHPTELVATWVTMPDGMRDFVGRLVAVQVLRSWGASGPRWTAAAAVYAFDGETGAKHLRNGNGARDLTLGEIQVRSRFNAAGRPWSAAAQLLRNFEDYSADDPDPFTAANRDQSDGWVLALDVGELSKPGAWTVGYRRARIEAFAANASFAQDDWVRWGSAAQSDGTDLNGHEFRAGLALSTNINVALRLFDAQAITSVQDGRRARIDFNARF